MNELTVDDGLVNTNAVVGSVGGIGAGGDLNFAPLTVRRNELALGSAVTELAVNTLVVNAPFSLDQRGFCNLKCR